MADGFVDDLRARDAEAAKQTSQTNVAQSPAAPSASVAEPGSSTETSTTGRASGVTFETTDATGPPAR